MTLSGYDLRNRNVRRVPFSDTGPLIRSSGLSYEKAQSTTSYRSSIEGKRVEPIEIDPYMYGLVRDNDFARYMAPNAALLQQLEGAGLAELTDYEVNGFTDTGHPFRTESYRVSTSIRSPRTYDSSAVGYGPRIGGPIFVSGVRVADSVNPLFHLGGTLSRQWSPSQKMPLTGTETQLQSDGTNAIRLVAPGRPEVNSSLVLLEFLQGVPAIPGKALLLTRSLAAGGDEWLNLLFGILPTVGDGLELGKALKEISIKLLKYRKQAGKFHRRSITFPQGMKSQIINEPGQIQDPGYIMSGPGYGFASRLTPGSTAYGASPFRLKSGSASSPPRVVTELFLSETRDVSFSGSFTYYVPTVPGLHGRLATYIENLDGVLSLGLDSTEVWQLGPWSWLLDWFWDIRENIAMISLAHDNDLVMNYGYAMETLKRVCVAKAKFQNGYTNHGITYCSTYSESVLKRRIRANPYGFVSTSDNGVFDAYRLSILSALGLSRR